MSVLNLLVIFVNLTKKTMLLFSYSNYASLRADLGYWVTKVCAQAKLH